MRTVNVLFRCKQCQAVTRQAMECDSCGNFPRPANVSHPGEFDARAFHQCSCGGWVVGRVVAGKYNSAIACDGRCMGATGLNCECSCGGANHGANHAQEA